MTGLLQTMMGPVLRRYRVRKIELTPRQFTVPLERIAIDRPVFFLSVPGGGLTLLLKCFQRLANTCFAHGNRLAWDAADNEMSVCVRNADMPTGALVLSQPVFPARHADEPVPLLDLRDGRQCRPLPLGARQCQP